MKPDAIDLDHPPRRVVSLVPSLTGSLFDLGLGLFVVGVTDYCLPPNEGTTHLPRVGGPKDANLAAIVALNPDLVFANQEENSKELVEGLVAAGVPVWLSFPKTVRASLDDLWALERLFRVRNAAMQLRLLEDSLKLADLGLADAPRLRYFCPIWQGLQADGTLWWMTFNGDTYSSDLLRIFGGENVFAQRLRRYPLEANLGQVAPEAAGERDVRYPVVGVADVLAAGPELILLPDEPYDFQPRHLEEIQYLLADTPACRNGRVFRLDGKLITWHGTHLGKSLTDLPQFFSRIEDL